MLASSSWVDQAPNFRQEIRQSHYRNDPVKYDLNLTLNLPSLVTSSCKAWHLNVHLNVYFYLNLFYKLHMNPDLVIICTKNEFSPKFWNVSKRFQLHLAQGS